MRAKFPQVRRPHATARDFAYETIRGYILDGTLYPGQRLSEGEIATQLGVSRTPVREALGNLAVDGLVTITPYRGATVSISSESDIFEEYMIRGALEGLAIKLAARYITEDGLQSVKASLDKMEEALASDDLEGYFKHHEAFHTALYSASRAPRLCKMIMNSWAMGQRYRRVLLASEKNVPREMGMHRRLYENCAARDGELAARVYEHDLLDYAREVARVTGAATTPQR